MLINNSCDNIWNSIERKQKNRENGCAMLIVFHHYGYKRLSLAYSKDKNEEGIHFFYSLSALAPRHETTADTQKHE